MILFGAVLGPKTKKKLEKKNADHVGIMCTARHPQIAEASQFQQITKKRESPLLSLVSAFII